MLPPSRIMLAARSWLRSRRRGRRFLLLLLCSPVLIPFLFFAFPIICAAELCLRLCGGAGGGKTIGGVGGGEGEDPAAAAREHDARLRACEEGRSCCRRFDGGGAEEGEREVGLLQRYLEDQMGLVGSVFECVDEFDSEDDDDGDVGLLGTNRSPLLS